MLACPVHAQDTTATFLEDAARPVQAIGMVTARGATLWDDYRCTGTLISATEVLTAAHCVIDQRERHVLDPGDIAFFAGQGADGYVTSRAVVRVEVDPRFTADSWGAAMLRLARVPLFKTHTDVALLTLASPIPPELVAPIPLGRDAGFFGSVALLGYGGGSDALVPYRFCDMINLSQAAYALDCLADYGVSGAAVLAPVEGAWRVMGVVSIIAEGRGYFQTFGPRVTQARIDALRLGVASRPTMAPMPAPSLRPERAPGLGSDAGGGAAESAPVETGD